MQLVLEQNAHYISSIVTVELHPQIALTPISAPLGLLDIEEGLHPIARPVAMAQIVAHLSVGRQISGAGGSSKNSQIQDSAGITMTRHPFSPTLAMPFVAVQ